MEEYPYTETAHALHDKLEGMTEGSVYLTEEDVKCLLMAIAIAYEY